MSSSALSPEARVVLLTAAGPECDPDIRRWLAGDIEWRRLFGLALQERASMPVWRRLSALVPDDIPAEIAQPLRRSAMVSSFKQLHLEARLGESVQALRDAGIRVLLLKGAALALTVYRSFEERPMGDLDLLVDAEHASRAQTILQGLGWLAEDGGSAARFYEQHQHLAPLLDPSGTGVKLEVHTELFFQGHPFALDTKQLWQHAREIPLGAGTVAVPSDTHALLHLCVHFAWSHMAMHGAWRTFRDLHAMQQAGSIEWDLLCRTAEEARAGTACYWTLRLARDLAGFPAPERVLQRLAPPLPRPAREIVARHLGTIVLPASSAGCPSTRMVKWMWEAAIRPRRSGHGAVRPWSREEVAVETFSHGPAARGRDKVRLHLRKLSLWRRYLASLLTRADLASTAAGQ
jgi:hypothetical protein